MNSARVALPVATSRWQFITKPYLVVVLVSVIPLFVQLLTGAQFMDGARNLHWSLTVVEQPGYVFGRATDPLDRVAGFVPDPPTLAPLQRQVPDGGPRFNTWWGPLPFALNALVWWATGSRLVLALLAPLTFMVAVWAVYWCGRDLFDARIALAAAVFTGLFPIFAEYSVSAYSEALMALLLLLTFWAYAGNRTTQAALWGALLALCKIHMAPVLLVGFGAAFLYRLWHSERGTALLHPLIAALAPVMVLGVWALMVGVAPSGIAPSWWVFWRLLPDMLTMLFYLPWYGAALTLGVIGWCLVRGLRRAPGATEPRLVAAVMIAATLGTLLLYTATPSASNSPRPALPVLPLISLYAAVGWSTLSTAWARRIGFYLVALFTVIGGFTTYTLAELGRYQRTYAPVYALLNTLPSGFTITSEYWGTAYMTRRGAAWFEGDDRFLQTMLTDPRAFARYIEQHPIRAVVVPTPALAAAFSSPAAPRETQIQWGSEVIAVLQSRAQRVPVSAFYDVYVLNRPGD